MTFLPRLILLARSAAQAGEVPVAACVVSGDGVLLASAHNQVEAQNDVTAHAELLVLREASRVRGDKYLHDCTLYVTLEPCAMCAQAASLARVKKVVFGAYDPKSGGVEHGARVFVHPTCHHVPQVVGGVMQAECAQLLSDFFAARRSAVASHDLT